MKTSLHEIKPYATKDGSQILELMHPALHGNTNQSLAVATIEPGQATITHRHKTSEELYHVSRGTGIMTLDRDEFPVAAGDTICIPPGVFHKLKNNGQEPLIILCCCAPAYSHHDTEMG